MNNQILLLILFIGCLWLIMDSFGGSGFIKAKVKEMFT